MRKIYESDTDRKKQGVVLDTVARYFGYELEEMPNLHLWDGEFRNDDGLVILAEVKVHHRRLTEVMISKKKIDAILEEAYKRECSAKLIIAWEELHELGICDLLTCIKTVRKGGRRDRDDPQDIEWCYFIPLIEFEMYHEEPWGWEK